MSEITQLTQNSEKGNGTIIIKSAQLTKSSWDKINGERVRRGVKKREKKKKKEKDVEYNKQGISRQIPCAIFLIERPQAGFRKVRVNVVH